MQYVASQTQSGIGACKLALSTRRESLKRCRIAAEISQIATCQWGRFTPHYAFGYACRNDGDLELLDPELHSPEMLKCVWEDAITDIVVVR